MNFSRFLPIKKCFRRPQLTPKNVLAALFLAAGKCRIHCPEIAEYYSSKVSQGKHRICALVCTARKILRMCWGMMKSGKPYISKTAE